jgi:hypothetical protein
MLNLSVGELKKVTELVELSCQIIAPYKAGVRDKGADKIEFKPEDVVKILLEAANLLGLDCQVILSLAINSC